jgi:hypothetical protein
VADLEQEFEELRSEARQLISTRKLPGTTTLVAVEGGEMLRAASLCRVCGRRIEPSETPYRITYGVPTWQGPPFGFIFSVTQPGSSRPRMRSAARNSL